MSTHAEPAKSVGRPPAFSEKEKLSVNSARAKSRLQAHSERRAVINRIIEEGGSTTLEKLNAHFGFDMRSVVLGLINSGWILVEKKQ